MSASEVTVHKGKCPEGRNGPKVRPEHRCSVHKEIVHRKGQGLRLGQSKAAHFKVE